MKKFIFLNVTVLLIIISCAQQKSSPIEGVWQVVSWEQMKGDTLVAKLGREYTGNEMKIWSGNYFTFIGQYKADTNVINNYGGGTFKLDGNKYEESLLYPTQSTVKLLLEIKNDTVIETWPVDENGQIFKSLYNIQKLTKKKTSL